MWMGKRPISLLMIILVIASTSPDHLFFFFFNIDTSTTTASAAALSITTNNTDNHELARQQMVNNNNNNNNSNNNNNNRGASASASGSGSASASVSGGGGGRRRRVTAVFVFGDSSSDPGNNNYVLTPFRSNFRPYGRDFLNHSPTGRFSNGRLSPDFIAEYVGVKKNIPPYLDPTLSMEELLTGVSFASAGSGYDPLTPQLSGVISMTGQLEYFADYRRRIEDAVGKDEAARVVSNALFIVCAGTNDFVVNYYNFPFRRGKYSVPQYQQFLLQHVEQFIKGLWDQGARKIAVAGLPPMGCFPIVMTIMTKSIRTALHRSCIQPLCSVATEYNKLLQNRLMAILSQLEAQAQAQATAPTPTRIGYMDINTLVADIIQNPQKHGFEEVRYGCCGTGLLEASFLCNPTSLVCPDASKYVFWDSIHPTEKIYLIAAEALRPVIDQIIAV